MEQTRWLNPSQPQTLQIAVFLLYMDAAFNVLNMLIAAALPLILLVLVAGQVVAGWGIANERKWAYALGIAVAVLPFVLRFVLLGNPFAAASVLNLMFEIALVALLVHPQSREYQRIWFS